MPMKAWIYWWRHVPSIAWLLLKLRIFIIASDCFAFACLPVQAALCLDVADELIDQFKAWDVS
jgi:hypothetical protein